MVRPCVCILKRGARWARSFSDRKEIEKRQEENRKERERAAAHFKELFPNFAGEPKAQDILKLRLYEQQHGKCLYSGKEIDLRRLPEKVMRKSTTRCRFRALGTTVSTIKCWCWAQKTKTNATAHRMNIWTARATAGLGGRLPSAFQAAVSRMPRSSGC